MSVLKPRTRVVYFRVSEDEFRQLHALCELRGERSLSDLARSAMRQMLQGNGGAGEQTVAQKLSQLDATLAELSQALKRFAAEGKASARKASATKGDRG
jgi:hypothetical protein